MKSLAKLQRHDELSMFSPALAERIYQAVERDLWYHYYTDPHGDAFIDGVELIGTPDGEQSISVTVSVTCYPSEQQWADYYSREHRYSQYVLRMPMDYTKTHTVEIGV